MKKRNIQKVFIYKGVTIHISRPLLGYPMYPAFHLENKTDGYYIRIYEELDGDKKWALNSMMIDFTITDRLSLWKIKEMIKERVGHIKGLRLLYNMVR